MSWLSVAMFSILALSSSLRLVPQKKSTADLVDVVRPYVIQMAVQITSINRANPAAPAILKQTLDCFQGSQVCVVGTGFFVNANGDVVTASHVATKIQQIIQILGVAGIKAAATIGVSIPNVETDHFVMSSGTQLYPVAFVAMEQTRDIALFHATVNPFAETTPIFEGVGAPHLPHTKAGFLALALTRPRDTEEIFVCGFPFGVPGLVTTSGEIASAWKDERLLTASDQKVTEVYWIDLRINPGNSGGPVLRKSDEGVLGIVVELKGSIGIAVPAKYIADFLKTRGIQWTAAEMH